MLNKEKFSAWFLKPLKDLEFTMQIGKEKIRFETTGIFIPTRYGIKELFFIIFF